jgi:hypothetical protein
MRPDETEKRSPLETFLKALIASYQDEYDSVPDLRDELVKPIAGWLLTIETKTERARPN